jgi:PAS domain S-box-containing protein
MKSPNKKASLPSGTEVDRTQSPGKQAKKNRGSRDKSRPESSGQEESRQLVHKLLLYQIEMEMQNVELRRAYAEQAVSRERLADLYNFAPVGYVTVGESGVILEANLTATTLLGAAQDTLIERPLTRFILPEDQDVFNLLCRALFTTGKPQGCEVRLLQSDSPPFWARLEAIASRIGESRQPAGFVVISDISAGKQAEEALRESRCQLEMLNESLERRVTDSVEDLLNKDRMLLMQNRQAAMGEMINNIAHQWRQPLNNVSLIVQNLQFDCAAGTLTPDAMAETVKTAMEIIFYMSHTIDDFRNFFRLDKEKSNFLISTSIGVSLDFMKPSLAGHGITIQLEEAGDVVAHGYPNEYAQVLLNIFNNAKDVLLEREISSLRISIRVSHENDRSVVRVRDNGGGIDPGIVPKIFDPYFTTKGQTQGTGIGLYMSKMIIEQNMGGTLTAYNVDGGAEFKIEV